jgi:hypothetical protein
MGGCIVLMRGEFRGGEPSEKHAYSTVSDAKVWQKESTLEVNKALEIASPPLTPSSQRVSALLRRWLDHLPQS